MEKLLVAIFGDITHWVPPVIMAAIAVFAVWWIARGVAQRFSAMEESQKAVTAAIAQLPDLFEKMKSLEIASASHSLSLHDMRRDAQGFVTRTEFVDGIRQSANALHTRVDTLVLEVDRLKRPTRRSR